MFYQVERIHNNVAELLRITIDAATAAEAAEVLKSYGFEIVSASEYGRITVK